MWDFKIFQGSLTNGVMATAGNVVFGSIRDGNIVALDAQYRQAPVALPDGRGHRGGADELRGGRPAVHGGGGGQFRLRLRAAAIAKMRMPLRGVLPIAPTPFTESGDVDFDGQRRVLDCMIDQGVDAICVLANFSEQFLLTDEERNQLTEVALTHVAGRVPVIVTCSHFSTRIAAERGRRAASLGAAMLMLMPPYHGVSLRADEDGILSHFGAVADAARIPLMVQDAPLSGVYLSVPFLVRLAKTVALVNAFKIEVTRRGRQAACAHCRWR